MHFLPKDKEMAQTIWRRTQSGLERIQELALQIGTNVRMLMTSGAQIQVKGIFLEKSEKPKMPGFEKGLRNFREGDTFYQEWVPRSGPQGQETKQRIERATHTNPVFLLTSLLNQAHGSPGNSIPESQEGKNPVCLITQDPETPLMVKLTDPTQEDFFQKNTGWGLEPMFHYKKPPEALQFSKLLIQETREGRNPLISEEFQTEKTSELASDIWATLVDDGEGDDLTQTLQLGTHPQLRYCLNVFAEILSRSNWLVISQEETQIEAIR